MQVIVHIADAPCHGRKYHDGVGDIYPSGDPAKTSHHDLMEEIAKRGIQYYFGHINERATAKMVGVLNKSLMQLSDRKQIIIMFADRCMQICLCLTEPHPRCRSILMTLIHVLYSLPHCQTANSPTVIFLYIQIL